MVLQIIKKFSVFYRTWRFIAASQNSAASPYPESLRYSPRTAIVFLEDSLYIILPFSPRSSMWSLRKTLYARRVSAICATCSAYLVLLNLVARKVCGKEYRSWSSQLCNVLHSLRPNYLVHSSASYSRTPQCLFHTHIKTCKILVLYDLSSVFLDSKLDDWSLWTER
jgi:hypothetical protein